MSKAIAAEAAIFNNFLSNGVWTFRGLARQANGWKARATRLGKFNLICLGGVGMSVLLLQVQVDGLGLNTHLASFVSIVAVSVWNCAMTLKFGWTVPVPGAVESPEPVGVTRWG